MAKIVIALDPGTASVGGLELVRYLSRDSGAELLGLLIEDVSVLEHGRSQLAREVLLSGAERRLDAKILEKQIHAQVAGVRARFEQMAGQLGLRHGFHAIRGEMINELMKSASDAQTLIIDVHTIRQHVSFAASIERLITVKIPALLFAKERWARGSGIVAVVDTEASAAAVLSAALSLSASSGSPVTVVLPNLEPAREQSLLDKIREIHTAHGAEPAHVLTADVARPVDIVRAAARSRAGLWVLARRDATTDAAVVADLLEMTGGSVLLVA